ncbi:MAG: class I SAM-dependent methyltransferase, partial [Candidatus Abyssobacteria bacterium SURF_17]
MAMDFRMDVAKYYDYFPVPFNDIDFYKTRIPAPASSILELGCGTGRVLIPLAPHCGHILGVDNSEAMLALCRAKLQAAGIPQEKAEVRLGNIAKKLRLARKFDLIIAPFRVFQALVTQDEIRAFFATVGSHLA